MTNVNKGKIELKFYSIMVARPFSSMKPGAYTGAGYSAKPMNEICNVQIKSPYLNLNSLQNYNLRK